MSTPLLLDSLNSPQRIHGRHTVTERREDHTSVCSSDGKISKNVVLRAWIHRVNVNYPPTFLEGQTSLTYPAKGFDRFSRLKKKKKISQAHAQPHRVGGGVCCSRRQISRCLSQADESSFFLWCCEAFSPPRLHQVRWFSAVIKLKISRVHGENKRG